jgi:DNA polymerase-4
LGYYWYLRLRGWEIDDLDFSRKSYGNSFALPNPLVTQAELAPIMTKLTQKMTGRMRRAGYAAQGVHLSLVYRDLTHWQKGMKTNEVLIDGRDIYKKITKLYQYCPYLKPVREIAVSCFNLLKTEMLQLDLFGAVDQLNRLNQALDQVNEKWSNFVITPARMLYTSDVVHDRIAFGNIKELEEFTLNKL